MSAVVNASGTITPAPVPAPQPVPAPDPVPDKVVKFSPVWEVVGPYTKRLEHPAGHIVMVWNETGQQSICFAPKGDVDWRLKKV